MRVLLVVLLLVASTNANADWHQGVLHTLGFGYDVTLKITAVNKTTCTCYSPWPDSLCVSRTRQDFKEIYAFLLKARATREPVWVNIDENTCSVVAAYETDN